MDIDEEEIQEEEECDFTFKLGASTISFRGQHLQEAQWIQSLKDEEESTYESPVDINISYTEPVELDPLRWHHYDVTCKKIKIINNGNTLLFNASWHDERPYLTGGPLLEKYIFSQLHFHWGKNDMEGSEHTIDGGRAPMEMHVLHFNSTYLTQEEALGETDGIVVLAYLFKLQTSINPEIELLVEKIPQILEAGKCARLDTTPLSYFVNKFTSDYFLYWGSIMTHASRYSVLWLICREPVGVSATQMESLRNLYDKKDEPLLRNFREIKPIGERQVYHISPSGSKFSTLYPIARPGAFL